MNVTSSSPTVKSEPASERYWPGAALTGVALIWGINIPVMKTGLDQLDAYVFNAIRLTISTVVLVVWAQVERYRATQPQQDVSRIRLLIYGILASGLYQLLFLRGMERTTSGNTALIMATVPVWTALLARLWIGEHLKRVAWAGLLVALIGTITVALEETSVTTGTEHLSGNLCILCAALMWSGATVYSRPMLQLISPLRLAASAALVTWPLHLLFAAGRYTNSLSALQSIDIWLILVYTGVLSSGLALPMWNLGVRHAGAGHAAVIQNLVPLVAILAAWISRGESASRTQLFGGGLILGGLVIMCHGRQNHDADETSANQASYANALKREQHHE